MAFKFAKPEVSVTPEVAKEAIPEQKAYALEQPAQTEAQSESIVAITKEFLKLHKLFLQHDMKATIDKMEAYKKALHAYANEHADADSPSVFSTPNGSVTFSPRGKETVVKDPANLLHVLTSKFGVGQAMSTVKIQITPLKKLLSELELKDHVTEERSHRTVKEVKHLD